MPDTTSTRAATTEKFSDRIAVSADYAGELDLATSISDKGYTNNFDLKLKLFDTYYSGTSLGLRYSWGSAEGKMLPSTGVDGTTTDNSFSSFQLGLWKIGRFSPIMGDGGIAVHFSTESMPFMGVGSGNIAGVAHGVEGKTPSLGEASSRRYVVGSSSVFKVDVPIGDRFPTLGAGVGFTQSVGVGEASELNRLRLGLMFLLDIGLDDAGVRTANGVDTPAGPAVLMQAYWALFHNFMMLKATSDALTGRQQAFTDYMGMQGGISSGSTSDLSLLQGGSAFAGSFGNLGAPVLSAEESIWYGLFIAAESVGGAAFLFGQDGDSAKRGGGSAILGAFKLSHYYFANIHSPNARQSKLRTNPKSVETNEEIIAAANFALGSLIALLSGAGGSAVAAGVGVDANLKTAASPAAVSPTLIENTTVSLIPVTANDGGHSRTGLSIYNALKNHLFTQVMFLSPMLGASNAANIPSQEKPFEGASTSTDLHAAMGGRLPGKLGIFKLTGSLGLDVVEPFGDPKATSGIGAIAILNATAELTKSGAGISLGAFATYHKLFPDDTRREAGITLGLTF